MDDCMRTLQQAFQTPLPDHSWLAEREAAWDALHQELGKEERKLLLGLVDANSALLDETSLHSFACGVRFGMALSRELHKE